MSTNHFAAWLGHVFDRPRAMSARAALVCAAILSASTWVQADMYLPNPGFNLGSSTNNQYGGATTTFTPAVNALVTVNSNNVSMNVGNLSFEYNTYGSATGANAPFFSGGAAQSGGFFFGGNPNIQVDPGFQLSWAQIVRSTFSGNNVWSAPNNTWFPDTTTTTNPAYPFLSIAKTGNTLNQPSVAFQDFPNRFPAQGAQTWLAELGLVAINTTEHEVRVIGTFDWGFGVTNANPGTIANITATTPFGWGAPTANYMTTEQDFFNPASNGDWTIDQNAAFFATPEPASVVLLILAIACAFIIGLQQKRATTATERP